MAHMIFDELHIVSDLHLGGPDKEKQIFGGREALPKWVLNLAQEHEKRIGLVINGDIFDFLAVEDAKHFDPENAVSKLDAMVHDYEEIFDALRAFVSGVNRRLILIIGNHDVELALPQVQAALRKHIAPDEQVAARIRMDMDGYAFECQVGDRFVHCVHGNAGDAWNRVDYAQAVRVGQQFSEGKTKSTFKPNAGTELVIEVMNKAKDKYPFVDLLKPEGAQLAATLLAIDRSLWGQISAIVNPLGTLVVTKIARWFLSTPSEGEVLRVRELSRGERETVAKSLIDEVNRAFKAGDEPLDHVVQGAERLGVLDNVHAVFRNIMNGDPKSSLRSAMRDQIKEDRTFDFSAEDEVFEYLDRHVPPEIDFIVAGHTHLERALRRTRGKGVYFNSGTWIRLIPMHQHYLASEESFEHFFENILKAPSVAALAQYDLERRTAVAIWAENGRVYGELRHVRDDGSHIAVKGSRLACLD